jgi:hypothetical protein
MNPRVTPRWTRVGAGAVAVGATLWPLGARADDRSEALAVLLAIEHAPSLEAETKSPGAVSPLVATDDAITRAHDALERGTRMRNSGDEAHARLAEGLALEWAETARDRARTTAEELKASQAERAAIDATARVERERALLEEAIARSGRMRAEVQKAAKKGPEEHAKEHTSTAAAGDVPPKPKPGRAGKGGSGGPPGADQDAPGPGSR